MKKTVSLPFCAENRVSATAKNSSSVRSKAESGSPEREPRVGKVLGWVLAALLIGSPVAQAESVSPVPGGTSSVQNQPAPAAPACKNYDQYTTRAEAVINITPPCQTVSPEMGGLRSWFADKGFGIAARSTLLGLNYDVAGHNHQPQQYNGQNPSHYAQLNGILTYDLARIGFSKDSQLTIEGNLTASDYKRGYPSQATMMFFAVNQRFLDKQVEIQYGYMPTVRGYYGATLGGNTSTAALGPGSVIPFGLGMSVFSPTPAFTLITKDPSLKFYNSITASRSASPTGFQNDLDVNPTGFRLTVPGAKMFYIDEFGYKAAASATENAKWFRVGAMYNTSSFKNFETGKLSDKNYGGYVAATYQVTNPNGTPRGWYIDGKFDYAPEDRNLFYKDFQATIYSIGPFSSRPVDMFAVGYSTSFFSRDLQNNVHRAGGTANPSSTGISIAYAARLARGVYLASSVTHTVNPAFTASLPVAWIVQESLNLAF